MSKKLLTEFQPITKEKFLQKIFDDIKEKNLDKLIWETQGSIKLDPFYTKEDIDFSCADFYPKLKNSWNIAQKIWVKNIQKANKRAKELLKYGTDELHFKLSKNITNVDFNILLEEINNKNIYVHTYSPLKLVDSFIHYLERKNINNEEFKGGLVSLNKPNKNTIHKLLVKTAHFPSLKIINFLGKNNSATHEITNLLFHSILLISNLLEKGVSFDSIVKKTYFTFYATDSYLIEIAKLRAFKVLWAHISQAYNSQNLNVHILSSSNILEQKENNHFHLLQSQTQAMSSVLGGANSVYLQPFNKKKLKFSERIAINQQLLLKEESKFGNTLNPVDGSYYLEYITKLLAEKSWEDFLQILENHNTNSILPDFNKIILFSINNKCVEKNDLPSKGDITITNAEEISKKKIYSEKDIIDIEHLNYDAAGIPPFLRGPYSTMYVKRPWTIRQYAGFSTAEESNIFYKRNLQAGQKGLSVAFDLPTHRGYDSDNPEILSDVGKTGVAIDTILDMEILFNEIPLDKTSVSLTMNGAVIPIMAFFIANAMNSGIDIKHLRGTIQNDILKEFIVRNTYIYPPKPSMKILTDTIEYISKYMPNFNSISISGYHFQEAGASKDIELAFTLADGLEYIKAGLNTGIDIDDFAPKLSFFWAIGMDHFMEIAKLRAARVLWAKIVKRFNPKNPKSLALRTHSQTSGWSLTKQDPINNIGRTCIEAMGAVLGHTQSLHTNSYDEAVSLPTDFSSKVARDTQLYIQNETDICRAIDPFAGSYYVEKLTHELIHKTWGHIVEIEKMGGMTKAIESGFPSRKIEEKALEIQANIDSQKNIIIGVNKYKFAVKEIQTVLEVDNTKVVNQQINKLKRIKKERNSAEVSTALWDITHCAQTGEGNLLELAIIAAQKKATLGEISMALENIFGRYKVINKIITGVYKNVYINNKDFKKVLKLSDKFSSIHGRRPRILVAKLGQDGHDRGIKIIASGFSDAGFDVDIGPLFQSPKDVVKQAIENDVHIIGVSSHSGSHKTLVPELINELKIADRSDIYVIVGGIIPYQDYSFLYECGVAAIFESGTSLTVISLEVLELLIKYRNE